MPTDQAAPNRPPPASGPPSPTGWRRSPAPGEAGPPELAAFVPPGPPAVRRLTLVELIKYDLDQRLQRGLDRPLKTTSPTSRNWPAAARRATCSTRTSTSASGPGETVRPSDYYQQFPERAARAGPAARRDGLDAVDVRVLGPGRRPTSGPATGSTSSTCSPCSARGSSPRCSWPGRRACSGWWRSRCRPTAGPRPRPWPSSTTRTSSGCTTSGSCAEREIQLVYMPYLPGGTLGDVLAHVRTRAGGRADRADAARSGRREPGPPRRSAAGLVADAGRRGRPELAGDRLRARGQAGRGPRLRPPPRACCTGT